MIRMCSIRRKSTVLVLALTACASAAAPPALETAADTANTADLAPDIALPQPTMICISEADRFHFAASGTYQFRLVAATIGPMTDASLCIEQDPTPDGKCQQAVKTPFPDVWQKTVTHDNQLTMYGVDDTGAAPLQTDCSEDNRPRSYVTFHNQTRTSVFTFLVERVAEAP